MGANGAATRGLGRSIGVVVRRPHVDFARVIVDVVIELHRLDIVVLDVLIRVEVLGSRGILVIRWEDPRNAGVE